MSVVSIRQWCSKRRNMRLHCDCSSDVCSADLKHRRMESRAAERIERFAGRIRHAGRRRRFAREEVAGHSGGQRTEGRSEEHTSELQSPCNLVCRLLLEKKKSTMEDIACNTDTG